MYASPTKSGLSSSAPPRILRFKVSVDSSSECIVPLRCEPSRTTIGEVVSAVVARLQNKFASLKAADGAVSRVTLVSGVGSNVFPLDLLLNADDALECYVDETTTDCGLVIDAVISTDTPRTPKRAGSSPKLSDTAATYVAQSRRLQALRTSRDDGTETDALQDRDDEPAGHRPAHRAPHSVEAHRNRPRRGQPYQRRCDGRRWPAVAAVPPGGRSSRHYRPAAAPTGLGCRHPPWEPEVGGASCRREAEGAGAASTAATAPQ
jgi:hypothetical protein